MRIEGNVTDVSDAGDYLAVKAQCKLKKSAQWQPMFMVELRIPHWASKSYYIGRRLRLDVEVT